MMTEKQAVSFLKALTAKHGVQDGLQMLAEEVGVTWHTAYGWYRRKSVPQWRIDSIRKVSAYLERAGK